jgi:hypothetical protein
MESMLFRVDRDWGKSSTSSQRLVRVGPARGPQQTPNGRHGSFSFVGVTFLPYHFLVALWAAMRSGIIADRKKMPHGLGEEKNVPSGRLD